jgi:hypothetical protein
LSVGKPYEAKVSCTVWVKGKARDYIKGLPIDIPKTFKRVVRKVADFIPGTKIDVNVITYQM